MDIYVSDNNLRGAITDEGDCRRQYGADTAKKVTLRVAALRAADSLADFWPPKSGPERGDRAGTFSVDLKQPYRLLFEAYEATAMPDRSDERLRWKSIMAIHILGIEDTHE
jgi:proteic killer suppression protein